MRRILVYGVVRVMAALVGGFSFALDYTGESILSISSGNWGIIGLVAFGVFVLITLGREIDLALQQRPEIIVESKVHRNQAFLEVRNTGGSGEFQATVRVVATNFPPQLYDMCWGSPPHLGHPINKDGDASILVGRLTEEFCGYGPKPERGLVLFKIGEAGEKEELYLSSPQVSEQVKLSKRYPTMGQIPEEKFTIEVSITSKPSPIKAFKPRRYLLEINHGNKDELVFTSESIPDKKGC